MVKYSIGETIPPDGDELVNYEIQIDLQGKLSSSDYPYHEGVISVYGTLDYAKTRAEWICELLNTLDGEEELPPEESNPLAYRLASALAAVCFGISDHVLYDWTDDYNERTGDEVDVVRIREEAHTFLGIPRKEEP